MIEVGLRKKPVLKRDSDRTYKDSRDKELGQRVSSGDRDAFAEVFRQLSSALVRYARSITCDEALAYDVLQDVFLKFWENRESLTPHTSLKAMLYTMVRNRSLNAIRERERRSPANHAASLTERAISDSGEPPLSVKDLDSHIQSWIDELPKRRAEAFRLSRFAGLSHQEIGRVMEVSERTVGTHILLALRFLRVRLDEYQQ